MTDLMSKLNIQQPTKTTTSNSGKTTLESQINKRAKEVVHEMLLKEFPNNYKKIEKSTLLKVDKNNKVKGGFVYEILKKYENVTSIKIKFKIEKTFQNCIEKMRGGTNDVMAGLLEKGDRNTYMDYYYWGKGKDNQFKQIVISKNSPFAKHSYELKTSMYFMQN